MHIEPLGELTPDQRIPEWLVSNEVEVAYFPGLQLRFVFDSIEDDEAPDEFALAVRRFLALTIRDRALAAEYVFQNYRQVCDAVGDDQVGVEIDGPADVWRDVRPDTIYVTRRFSGDRKVYVQVTAECSWEPEHGLQIVFREGSELARVSQQDGHLTHVDAYDLAESEDRIV